MSATSGSRSGACPTITNWCSSPGSQPWPIRHRMIEALLGALQRGYTEAIADPDGALDLLIAASPDLVRDVEREGLDLLMPLWTENGTIPFGLQTADRWNAFGEWLKEHGLLGEDVDIDAAWRGDLLPTTDMSTPVVATPKS